MLNALTIHQRLFEFYGHPEWSKPSSPLDELIVTVLSQNTNDKNRDRAFQALKERFPTWVMVRDADPSAVIDAIRSAGLANQKGQRIQAILQAISDQRNQENAGQDLFDLNFLAKLSPQEARQWLMQFKGVGPKTAAIVMLFSLGMPAFPVDTHIYRITGRLGLRPANMSVEQAHAHLEAQFPPEAYTAAHLNLIRLGREICQARRPNCPVCPLRDICDYGSTHNSSFRVIGDKF
jgi:endonuclease-3